MVHNTEEDSFGTRSILCQNCVYYNPIKNDLELNKIIFFSLIINWTAQLSKLKISEIAFLQLKCLKTRNSLYKNASLALNFVSRRKFK